MGEDTKEDWEEFYEWLDHEGWHYMLTQPVPSQFPPSIQSAMANLQFEFDQIRSRAAEEAAKFGVAY